MLLHIAAFTAADEAADIHFGTGLGKRKITGAKTHFHLFAKHFLHKEVQGLFEVGKTYIFGNI